jgi:hypothetical protein
VGEGANRTRGPDADKFPFLSEVEESAMEDVMLRAGQKKRQASAWLAFLLGDRPAVISTPPVLKSY